MKRKESLVSGGLEPAGNENPSTRCHLTEHEPLLHRSEVNDALEAIRDAEEFARNNLGREIKNRGLVAVREKPETEILDDDAEVACLYDPAFELSDLLGLIADRDMPELPLKTPPERLQEAIETPVDVSTVPEEERPWHPIEREDCPRCLSIGGQSIPAGAFIELRIDGRPIPAQLVDSSDGYARVELDAGLNPLEPGSIPVLVRLYSGTLARLAHPAEGRWD